MIGPPVDVVYTPLTISLLNKEENRQDGLSAFYSKKWSGRLSSKFILSHSDFSKKLSDEGANG